MMDRTDIIRINSLDHQMNDRDFSPEKVDQIRPLEERNGGIEITVCALGNFTADLLYLEQGFPILGLNNRGDGTEV